MTSAALDLCRQARRSHLCWDWNGAPGLGALLVGGPDGGAFLQAQLTSDVLALEPGTGQLSARLDRKGNLVAWFSLHRLPERGQPFPSYLAILPRAGIADLAADLARYVITEDVFLEDVSTDFDGCVEQGPDLGPAVAGRDDLSIADEDGGWTIVRSFTGDPGLMRLAPRGRGDASACREDAPMATAWRWLRIEAGLPLLGEDLAPGTRPLAETGLDARTVSVTKGCYLGQEVVARLRTYGTPARALRCLVFGGLDGGVLPPLPGPGSPLAAADGGVLGTWACGGLSVSVDHPVALAFLGRDHRTPGARLRLRLADGSSAEAEVLMPPLHDTTDQAARARRLHERAVHAFSRGDDGPAVALLEEAVAADPSCREAIEALGVILGRTGRYHDAIAIFRRLGEVAPDEPLVHTNLSLFFMKIGDRDEAERQKAQATLKRFAGLDDEREGRARAEADAESRRADAARKVAMFSEVLDIDPDDPLALMGLGNALVALDRIAEAEPHLARACSVQKDNSAAFLAHGKVLEQLGRSAEARDAFTAGIAVAGRKGDLMPLREMEHRLLLLAEA